MQSNDKDFLKSQFDKILVTVLMVGATGFLLHVMHHAPDQANVNQSWGLMTFFMGLLSGLITGRHIGNDAAEGTKQLLIKQTDPPPTIPPIPVLSEEPK